MPAAQIIRSGSVRVRLFLSRSGKYERHEIRWTDHHGQPHRLKRSHKPDALREARRIADDLARGHHHAELSLADLASFRLARQHLYGTGRTIEQACGEYANTVRLLKSQILKSEIPSLPDIARAFLRQSAIRNPQSSIPQAVAAFLLAKQQQGISARWHATLRSQLERFAADHPSDTACLTAPAVQRWFLTLPGLSARSRNNHLAAVQSLFHAPELRHHPERQSVLDLQPCATAPADNALWTPEEFRQLLHAAPPHLLPVLVLGGFGKLRASEIMRLDWSAVRLHEQRLLLRAGQTKTRRTRIVPLPPCAVAWLRTVAQPHGPLWPHGTCKFNADLRALAAACRLQWRPNALRNSAVTYDQILRPDLARVAREAGNSPKVLETEYLALDGITRRTARAWFAIVPPRTTAKILKLA